jgi:hypothetical protein
MNLDRRSRLLASLTMLLSMLAMLASLAACRHLHAAITSASTPAFASVAGQDTHVSRCKSHQAKNDLCATYVQAAKTTIDIPTLPVVPPFFANALVSAFFSPPVPVATGLRALTRVRAPDPPVCIRHCSFQL